MQFVTDTLGWRFLLALVLASTLWVRLTLEQNPERRDVYPTEIPVEVRGLPPGLVVANVVPPVKVRIAAPQESWRRLQAQSFRASVDLANAGPGLEQPAVTVEVSDPEVRVIETLPAKAIVRVEELRTASVPVRVTQSGSVPFGYRVVGEPTVVPTSVAVSGPSSVVENVSEAVAHVRMDEVKATIDRSLQPEPRGPNGVVSGVRLEPQTVTVTIQVEQIAASKAVSVVPQIKGQPAAGYWAGPITVDPPTIQILAEPSRLDTVAVLNTADVDVTGAQADVVKTVPILRQPGVTLVRDQAATVRVSVQPLSGQQVREAAVTVQDAGPALVSSASPAVVSFTLSGPQPTLLRLAGQDIAATVNASGLAAGTHTLPVAVQVPDGVRADRITPPLVTVTLTPK
jgi:YbbR domain-containing protein